MEHMDNHPSIHLMRMSEDMNTILLTIPQVINVLILGLVSFHHNILSLFTQTAFGAPMRRETILPILVTSYHFIEQCYLIMESEQPEGFQRGEQHLCALRTSHMQAKRIEPLLEGTLDKAEELLASELRGSRSVEHVLGFTKRFFELSSYRVDVLGDLPRRMNMIRRDVREIMDCLYYLEEEMSRIKMLLWDHKLRACIEGRDVKDSLLETCWSDLGLRRRMVRSWIIHSLYKYGSKEIPIDSMHLPAQGRDRDMRSWWNFLSP
ncbi:hypothetical protein ARMGADRAFT_571911 [Armillaria gallica]|uniref:Uncharacterized protein n=1 Tax=Armillaria gallica TaxID=47427 RepID=A0A2H3EFQ7_ARMGA|nr:hypothetical protein ARMGADRAFT_571911 [Armillaria gallica]